MLIEALCLVHITKNRFSLVVLVYVFKEIWKKNSHSCSCWSFALISAAGTGSDVFIIVENTGHDWRESSSNNTLMLKRDFLEERWGDMKLWGERSWGQIIEMRISTNIFVCRQLWQQRPQAELCALLWAYLPDPQALTRTWYPVEV